MRWFALRQGQSADQAQQRGRAHWHGEAGQQSPTRLAAESHPDPGLRLSQTGRAPGMGGYQFRQALGEGAARTGGVATVETTQAQADVDCAPERGQISGVPVIVTVHGPARTPTIRTAATRSRAMCGDVYKVRAAAHDLLDAAARHRTELMHALFRGDPHPHCQALI
jgi:hypothetical protein